MDRQLQLQLLLLLLLLSTCKVFVSSRPTDHQRVEPKERERKKWNETKKRKRFKNSLNCSAVFRRRRGVRWVRRGNQVVRFHPFTHSFKETHRSVILIGTLREQPLKVHTITVQHLHHQHFAWHCASGAAASANWQQQQQCWHSLLPVAPHA